MKFKVIISSMAILVMALFFIISCNKKQSSDSNPTNILLNIAHKADTVTTLPALANGDAVIWSHNGIYTKVTFEAATEISEPEDKAPSPELTSSCSDAFAGTARKASKTSFATPANFLRYSSINALRSVLPTDTYMRSLGISNSATSTRVSQENYNDSVSTSYLYAITRESDNDFHLIIGDSNPVAGNLFNCEASGNPATTASSYAAISAVRTYLKSYFGKDFCGASGYTLFSPAIRVKMLKGSLFFDIDHTAGTVGPSGFRPSTSWELHPLKAIGF